MQRAKILALAGFLTTIAGCGQFKFGGDPVLPTGTLVAQAAFAAVSEVQGIAAIYHSSGTSYTLRLSSITAPRSTDIIRVNSSDGVVLNTALGITSGAQNYPFSAPSGISFISVEIFLNVNPIGVAIFPSQ